MDAIKISYSTLYQLHERVVTAVRKNKALRGKQVATLFWTTAKTTMLVAWHRNPGLRTRT